METTPANSTSAIDNDLYDRLGERWYDAQDDPVALLRAERRLITPWIDTSLRNLFDGRRCDVLDVGCGAGLVSNPLSQAGHLVTGIDLSPESLKVASRHDTTGTVNYLLANACQIPFPDASFDAVCAMDFLEHVDQPQQVIAEISRVLRPGGRFFFNTFNRNALSWLVVIKGVEWFVKNTPKNMHVLELFIKPCELQSMCEHSGLRVEQMIGLRPRFSKPAFWKMLWRGTVTDDFEFTFTTSLTTGYGGRAIKPKEA